MNLDTRAIENLPLSGYRNFQSLINLVPGATPARFQNAVTDTPGRALTTNVNGQERGANNTRVDGSADILVTMPHHAVYVPPVESIQEVNISTNNFDAEQGMTGGAAVTVITKSGTNDFRGSAFAHARQQRAARVHLGRESRRRHTTKPKGIRNIDGGSLGGPIKKNKLFFFTDWEGTFERVGRSVTLLGPDRRLPHRRFQPDAGRADSERRRQPDPGSHHRRRHDAAPGGHGFRSVLRQSGRHRPLGVLERRAGQRHSRRRA